ncbi:hypothetical protein H4R19_000881 [Coemansia spiralis]|nr:hypothetical protein H4R19_000881 [Coemansia spiralis]
MHCLANETMYKLNIARIRQELPELRAPTLVTRKIGAIGTEPCRFYKFGKYLVFVNEERIKITTLYNQCIIDLIAESSAGQAQPVSTLPNTFRYNSNYPTAAH